MRLEFKPDLKAYRRDMQAIARKQLPYAMSLALTETAGHAGVGWQDEMRQGLDRPTPFTVNSVGVRAARKSTLTATVFIKDIAAQYLEPFVDGGPHFLGAKRGLLTPKNTPLNAYGNLPKAKLAQLRARPDVFIGPVRFKDGQVINGVWQRNAVQRGTRRGKLGRRTGDYGTKGKLSNMGSNLTTLKLLIRFSDPQQVKQRLDFRGRAERAVEQQLQPAFARALAKALDTGR